MLLSSRGGLGDRSFDRLSDRGGHVDGLGVLAGAELLAGGVGEDLAFSGFLGSFLVLLELPLAEAFLDGLAEDVHHEFNRLGGVVIGRYHIINRGGIATCVNHCDYRNVQTDSLFNCIGFLLNIPVIAMVDTCCDPTPIDYVIPANDDATKSIELIMDVMCKAIAEGLEERKLEKEKEAEAAPAEEAAATEAPERKLRPRRSAAAKAEAEAEAPAAE